MSLAPRVFALLACLVASVSYIGDITTSALVVFLLPTALLVGLVGLRMHGRMVVGLPVVGLLSWLGAEIVNLASGEFQGPAARTTAVAAACTGLTMLATASRAPALFLVPLTGIVAGALAFGAGGQVQVVAIATAGLGALALASIERDRRAVVGRRRSAGSLVFAVLLVSLAAVFAVLFQGQHDIREAQAPLRQNYEKPVTAPGFVSLPQPVIPTPSTAATSVPEVVSQPVLRPDRTAQVLRWLLVALGALASLLLVVAGRLVLASWSWRRYFRSIDRLHPGTVGAWLWAMAHMQRVGLAPPPASSPDLLAAGRLEGVDAELHDLVQRLAAVVAPAIFAAAADPAAEQESRTLSRELAEQAWAGAGAPRRASGRWHFAPRPVVLRRKVGT